MRLAGRRVLITGGTRGIGEAMAVAMAREGAAVVVSSRKPDGVEAAVARVREAVPGASVEGHAFHVGDLEALPAAFARVLDGGPVDVLVNNAGTNPYFGPMLQTSWPAWEKTFDVNLKGPFWLTRAFCEARFAVGGPGSVIFTSSVLGARAAVFQGVYGMTKAGLISMTQTLAAELGETGIRVNAIAPGVVETKLAAALTQNRAIHDQIMARTALKRVGRPEEIAGIAVFLACDESAYVTGQTFTVDGGYTVV